MIASTALFLVAMSGAGQIRAVEALPAALTLQADVAARAEPTDLRLRVDAFGLDGSSLRHHRWLAQTTTRATDATPATPATPLAPAPVSAPANASTETPAAGAAATCESCDIDCETCRESDRQARYVLHRRAALLRTHRAFGIAAWSSLIVTEVLGTILAIERPTWFGNGSCSASPDDFGCGSTYYTLNNIHETAAFVSVGLYTTAGILAVAAPDPDSASVGTDTASRTLRLHKALAFAHGAGMILMPILGILGATITNPDASRAFRTIHTGVGYATFAALTWAMAIELF